MDFYRQLRGLLPSHNTKIRIKIYNLYMCGLIYIDDVTNLHSQGKKVDTWTDVRMKPLRIYTNKSYISFFGFRTKNKILFERKRVPFLFLYLYFTNFFLYIDNTWTDLHKYVDGFTQNTWTDLHNTWTDLHKMLLYVE